MKEKKNKKKFLEDLEKKLRHKSKDGEKNEHQGLGAAGKDPKKQANESGLKSWNRLSYILLIILIIFTFLAFNNKKNENDAVNVAYSQFVNDINNRSISEVLIVENENIIEFEKDGIFYSTRIPYEDANLIALLIENDVVLNSELRERSQVLLILLQWLPWIALMVFFWFIISRQFRGRNNEAFNFGKSKAKMINNLNVKERFDDVKGCAEAIEELKDIVSFLKDPKKFSSLGAVTPKGLLIVGMPGTGKTLLARAVAGEASVPFFPISGSDFVEMFVGVGASRVRDLFDKGKKNSPCIIFIDEIDAVGRARGAGYGGGHDEREQTLNQLLVEMDGFSGEKGIVLIAATNRPDVLDRALLRPGRFDRQVVIEVPDRKGREEILKVHSKKIRLNPKADLGSIARATPGLSGADLANIINEAALIAAKKQSKLVNSEHLSLAKDKVVLGSERRSVFISDSERRNTAYHEAGHVLVSLLTPHANELEKVTIIPRGRALGITHFLPEDGKFTMNTKSINAQLRVLYGGRAAEEVVFKEATNGAVNDIEQATKLAKTMVCEWGLSRLGAIAYTEKKTPMYLPSSEFATAPSIHSEELMRKIDHEVKYILDAAYKDALKVLRNNINKLKRLAEALLEKETIDITEIRTILKMSSKKKLKPS